MDHFYEVLDTEIRGLNGTIFLFSGLSDQTAESIKSYEGVTKAWCEEAQSISKKSWRMLIPTIRAEDSEILVTFNPELDTDETYQRFIVNTPPDAWLCELSWRNNPWFPEVLEQERLHCLETEPEEYENIWEGKCRPAVEGAIYAKEVAEAMSDQRIVRLPYDPRLKVHTVWDLGWNDSMAIILVQKVRSELRIIEYIEDDHKTLDWYAAELNSKRYNWGTDWLPHDGDVKEFRTGKSAKQILQRFNRKVQIIPKIGVEDGIRMARMTFQQCLFDKVNAEKLVECLKRYRRSVNTKTNEPMKPVHDEFSHGADAFRYLAVSADLMTNEDEERTVSQDELWQTTVPGMGY
jgi:phage terminase large subunit